MGNVLPIREDGSVIKQVVGRDPIRVQRMSGLKDEKGWKTDPLFQIKLYYRAQDVMFEGEGGRRRVSGNDVYMEEKEEEEKKEEEGCSMEGGEMDEENIELADRLVKQQPFDDYRKEKIEQIKKIHDDNKASDAKEADTVFQDACKSLQTVQTTADVDGILECYYDWHQKQIWKS